MQFSRAFPVAAIAIVAVHVWVLASLGTSREGVLGRTACNWLQVCWRLRLLERLPAARKAWLGIRAC